MHYLVFLIPLLNVTAFLNPGVTPKWIALSVAVPLILLLQPHDEKSLNPLGLAWLVWAMLSLTWALSMPDGVMRLWQFILGAGIFVIGVGLSQAEMRKCFHAFCIGMTLSIIVAILQDKLDEGTCRWLCQLLGQEAVFRVTSEPSGTFVNANYLSEAGLVMLVIAIGLRNYLYTAAAVVSIVLPFSKGIVVAIAVLLVLLIWRKRPLWGAAAFFCMCFLVVHIALLMGAEDHRLWPRVALLGNTLVSLDWTGHGIGSYWAAYPLIHDALIATPDTVYSFKYKPRTAHNDLLTVGLETGIIGMVLVGSFVISLMRGIHTMREYTVAWWIVAAVLAIGLLAFPLYNATTLMMAALAAGFMWGHRIMGGGETR